MTWLIVISSSVLFFLWAMFAHPSPVDRQWVLDNTCPVKKAYVRYPDGMHEASCQPTGIVWELHQSR